MAHRPPGEMFAMTRVEGAPWTWNWTCGWWAPVAGEVDIKVDDKDFNLKVTFSVDNSGNVISAGPNSCPYGWKVEWKHKNKTKKKVFGYV